MLVFRETQSIRAVGGVSSRTGAVKIAPATPIAAAAPLPPRNFSQAGQMCPITQATPPPMRPCWARIQGRVALRSQQSVCNIGSEHRREALEYVHRADRGPSEVRAVVRCSWHRRCRLPWCERQHLSQNISPHQPGGRYAPEQVSEYQGRNRQYHCWAMLL